jgi:hypothetical protein
LAKLLPVDLACALNHANREPTTRVCLVLVLRQDVAVGGRFVGDESEIDLLVKVATAEPLDKEGDRGRSAVSVELLHEWGAVLGFEPYPQFPFRFTANDANRAVLRA